MDPGPAAPVQLCSKFLRGRGFQPLAANPLTAFLLLPFLRTAAIARAKDFKNMRIDLKPILRLDLVFDLFDQATIHVGTSATLFTNKMVMMFAWLDDFIAPFAVTKIHSLNQSHLN